MSCSFRLTSWGWVLWYYVQSMLGRRSDMCCFTCNNAACGQHVFLGSSFQIVSTDCAVLLKPQHFCFAFFQCTDNITSSMSPHSAGGSGGGFLGVLSSAFSHLLVQNVLRWSWWLWYGGCDMVVVIWWLWYGGVDMPLILQLFKTHWKFKWFSSLSYLNPPNTPI